MEKDEYWEKEFRSLSKDDSEPTQGKKRNYSKILLLVWSISIFSIVSLSVVTSLLFGQGLLYWPPDLIIQGLSFYGGVYVLLSILYTLERKAANPIGIAVDVL